MSDSTDLEPADDSPTTDDPTGLDALFVDQEGGQSTDETTMQGETTDESATEETNDELEGGVELFDEMRFRNGDVTGVFLSDIGDGYQAIAVEVNASGDILAMEDIGSTDALDRAVGMCEYWRQQNDKGILGADPEEGGGALGKIGQLFGGGGDS